MTSYQIGSTGQGVKNIQTWLNTFKFNNGTTLIVDGKYGTITSNAVKQFQKTVNIKQDGICGPVTLGYMYDYGKSHVAGSTTVKATTTTTVECIPTDIQQYLKATKNCQSTDKVIVSAARAIIGTSTSLKDKATKIFNWVRDNTSYTFYSNTKYGAKKAYTVRLMNCCDMAHLCNALARAVGIPARYLHVSAKFSSGTYGHVVSQLYYGGKWYNADATDNDNTLGNVTNWKLVSTKGTYRELPF